jgi:phosphatidate cytidylyltransferase
MLKTRVITAVLLLAVIIPALVFLSSRGWALLVLVMLVAAAWEWARLCGYSGARVYVLPLLVAAAAGLVLLYPPALKVGDAWLIGVALLWVLAVPAWLRWRDRVPAGPRLAIMGWLVLLACWYAVWRARDAGWIYLLLLMATVWIADIAAYFAGKAFGKHKLAPAVSPGKTWEGVIGAIVGVQIFAIVCILNEASVPNYFGGLAARAGWAGALLAALVLTGVSVIGDLFESLLKRRAGIKDSSNLLPGHGGVLDRVDALLSTLPVALALAALLGMIKP